MPQIWWCIHISHLIILFFGHFSKWIVGANIHVRAIISMRFDVARLIVLPTSAVWHPFLQMASRCEVYAICSCTSFSMRCIVLYISLFDVLCGILFSYLSHDSYLMWCGIICVMYLLSWFVMFYLRSLCRHVDGILMCRHVCLHWDPFYAMLAGCSLSSCMSLGHTDRSLVWMRVPVAEHLLEPLIREGIFLVW